MPKHYKAIAEYYDAENVGRSLLERDVPFFIEQLPKRRQTILELAVGTGRAAIPLAQSGHRIVGVDNDPAMLAIARRKRDSVGLTDKELRLVHGDALRLGLKQRFDWVCILFNTFLAFPTLAQQDKLLANVRRHLKPRGRLFMDFFYPDMRLLAERRTMSLDPMIFYVPMFDRTVQRITEIRPGDGVQTRSITFRYTWFDNHGIEHNEKSTFDLTYIFPRELLLLLERNGFHIERTWGDHDGSPLTADSLRIISCSRLH